MCVCLGYVWLGVVNSVIFFLRVDIRFSNFPFLQFSIIKIQNITIPDNNVSLLIVLCCNVCMCGLTIGRWSKKGRKKVEKGVVDRVRNCGMEVMCTVLWRDRNAGSYFRSSRSA